MSDQYQNMMIKIEQAIKASNPKRKVRVCYSAYKSDENDNAIDNLNEIAVHGKIRLVEMAEKFWGGKKSKDYKSEILENPTWLDITVCANEMIRTTRDTHHCFLEGIRKAISQNEKDVVIYNFSMGS